MDYQKIFKRYELKYLISDEQLQRIASAMEGYMKPDAYFRSTVRSLYFDTDNYRLARHSIEHPSYKEKLRLRSYCPAGDETLIFAELKKKYDSVVYKRRVDIPEGEAMKWICEKAAPPLEGQIIHEIDYFIDYYGSLKPAALITYDRLAYKSCKGDDLRITFDSNILARITDMTLEGPLYGKEILPGEKTIMEIKTSGGMPMWLTKALSSSHIYKSSFSKYGTVYKTMIYPGLCRRLSEATQALI